MIPRRWGGCSVVVGIGRRSTGRASVTQTLLALLARGVARVAPRLLVRRELAGSFFLFGLELGVPLELGLARRLGGRLAFRLALLARDPDFQHHGLALGEVFVGFLLGAKLLEQGALGFRGIGLAVHVFGLSLEKAHFIPCCSRLARGSPVTAPRCDSLGLAAPRRTACTSEIVRRASARKGVVAIVIGAW